jgi:hypothetical protein
MSMSNGQNGSRNRRTPPIIEGEAREITPQDAAQDATQAANPPESPSRQPDEKPAGTAPDQASSPEAATEAPSAERALSASTEEQPEETSASPAGARPESASRSLALPLLAGFVGGLVAFGAATVLVPQISGVKQETGKKQAEIEALNTRLAALEQKPAASAAAAPAGLTELQQRLAELESSLAGLKSAVSKAPAEKAAPPVDLSPLRRDLADLTTRAQTLDTRLAQVESQLSQTGARFGALETSLNAERSDLQSLAAREMVTPRQAKAPALAVTAQGLLAAVEAGRPFGQELAAAQSLGADPGKIAVLRPFAETGVRTAAALSDSFAPLAGPILAGENPKESGGLIDRLERSAASLVRIRRIGGAEGGGLAGDIARIESALAAGDVATALALEQHLPGPALALTEKWSAEAKARVDALAAARGILSDAFGQLTKP